MILLSKGHKLFPVNLTVQTFFKFTDLFICLFVLLLSREEREKPRLVTIFFICITPTYCLTQQLLPFIKAICRGNNQSCFLLYAVFYLCWHNNFCSKENRQLAWTFNSLSFNLLNYNCCSFFFFIHLSWLSVVSKAKKKETWFCDTETSES